MTGEDPPPPPSTFDPRLSHSLAHSRVHRTSGAAKMPQVMVVARNFMDMVAALPAAKIDMLYDSTFICEAVLRSFPALAKKNALQMLYVSAPMAAR